MMDTQFTQSRPPSPSPRHRSQVLWQIAVPLGVFILGILALAVLSVIRSSTDFEAGLHWANISAIFIITPILTFSFITLIILALLIYGLARLLKVIPAASLKVWSYFEIAKNYVRLASDQVTRPIVSANAWARQGQTLAGRVFHPRKAGQPSSEKVDI
ncbi:hypothetical protein ADN00_18415 [Ornatilinea apprima]|uniref:Uncharacterized protein n=1 Tax=Ornatilinea apprima TaxID=1134406 RepID=A0A0P6XM94_9CHLR|nr:hypothetical protein [Ornatilinea apprima]KPL70037.1 hypothetical protein ADN00_18415 [Ornatilinea apprima]